MNDSQCLAVNASNSTTGITLPTNWTSMVYVLAVCIPTFVIMFFTIVGNIIILFARAHVGHRITRLFVVNLAIADLMVSSLTL